MAEPRRAVVSRLRWDYVGRPNILFHLARRPVRKTREKSGGQWDRFESVDGSQRRLLHRPKTKIAGRRAGTSSLVSLGSVADLGGRSDSPCSCVLPWRWA